MSPLSHRVASRHLNRVAFRDVILAFGVNDLEQLSKLGRQFGVLSAYRSELSKSQNQQRHGELMADLQRMGYHKTSPLKSQWENMATKVVKHEKSILVPNIGFEDLHKLGNKYGQDAVLYKDRSGSIGVYFKDGMATMAFNPAGEGAMSKSTDPKSDYSKGRDFSFGLQLVEDQKFHYGDKPVTQEDIVKHLKNDKTTEESGGSDSEWWKSQTPDAKKKYCEDHPGSSYCGGT